MASHKFGLEKVTPHPVSTKGINPRCQIPYGLTANHILSSMTDFIDFLTFMNRQLISQKIPRLETFLMPASFSSLVGEFMTVRIPVYCKGIVKNRYHNGHPDLIPAGRFKDDAAQYCSVGIEVKGSRHRSGWQGHNPEDVWLMVFVFEANSANDEARALKNRVSPEVEAFRFVEVLGAKIKKSDWQFSGRSATSRRTITATVKPSGFKKMSANWIYRDPKFTSKPPLHRVKQKSQAKR